MSLSHRGTEPRPFPKEGHIDIHHRRCYIRPAILTDSQVDEILALAGKTPRPSLERLLDRNGNNNAPLELPVLEGNLTPLNQKLKLYKNPVGGKTMMLVRAEAGKFQLWEVKKVSAAEIKQLEEKKKPAAKTHRPVKARLNDKLSNGKAGMELTGRLSARKNPRRFEALDIWAHGHGPPRKTTKIRPNK